MAPRKLRVVIDPPLSGAANMARDEALLRCAAADRTRFTLRIYGWERPTLSLGRFQPRADALTDARLEAIGIDIVRRPTGGRAVLHRDETTYAFIGCTGDLLPSTVPAAYRVILSALRKTYERLGVVTDVSLREAGSRGARDAACFAEAGLADLIAEGKKLSGSAQMMREGALLQHGSLVHRHDTETLFAALDGDDRSKRARIDAYRRRTTDLASLVDPMPTSDKVVRSLVESFAELVGVGPQYGTLNDEERRIADSLIETYLDPEWTAPAIRRYHPEVETDMFPRGARIR